MQYLSQIFPLTHVIALTRPLMLGESIPLATTATSLGILVTLFLGGFAYANHQFRKRLFD